MLPSSHRFLLGRRDDVHTFIRVADSDKDTPSSQVQFTLKVSESVDIYLLYAETMSRQHSEKRPWISNEKWARSNLIPPARLYSDNDEDEAMVHT